MDEIKIGEIVRILDKGNYHYNCIGKVIATRPNSSVLIMQPIAHSSECRAGLYYDPNRMEYPNIYCEILKGRHWKILYG